MEDAKKWFQSKTIWTNLVAIVTGAGALVMGEVSLSTGVAPIVLALLNIILRIVTKQPIEG